MKNELLYLGIGAAAVYLFARAKKTTSPAAVPPTIIPGVTPGTTPPIAPSIGDDSVTIDKPSKVNPVDVDVMVNLIKHYSTEQHVSLEESYKRYFDIYEAGNDFQNAAILQAAWIKMNSPVAKTGIGMGVIVAALAGGYYLLNR